MAQENVREFMEFLNRDEELQKKLKTATEAYTGDKTDEKAVFEAVIVPIAKEAGYEFSFEDVEELAKASGVDELSEDELAAVAGGGYILNACGGLGITYDNDTGEAIDSNVHGFGCSEALGGATACFKGLGIGFGWTYKRKK